MANDVNPLVPTQPTNSFSAPVFAFECEQTKGSEMTHNQPIRPEALNLSVGSGTMSGKRVSEGGTTSLNTTKLAPETGQRNMKLNPTLQKLMFRKQQINDISEELQVQPQVLVRLFGANERNARRWSHGSDAAPPLFGALLRLLLHLKRQTPYPELAESFRLEAELFEALSPKAPPRQPTLTLKPRENVTVLREAGWVMPPETMAEVNAINAKLPKGYRFARYNQTPSIPPEVFAEIATINKRLPDGHKLTLQAPQPDRFAG